MGRQALPKEHHLKRRREYQKKNYHKWKDRMLEKIECECGCVVARSSKSEHTRSKKHIMMLNFKDKIKQDICETIIKSEK